MGIKFFIVIIVLITATGCSRKYETFSIIKKKDFLFGNEHSPIAPKMYPGKKQVGEFCTGQWLFTNNAVRDTHEHLNRMVRFTCPKDDYLLNSTVTQLWWTTLIYSRACIELETYCPRSRKR